MMKFFSVPPLREKKYFWAFLWGLLLAADLIAVMFFIAGERNMRRYIENDYNVQLIRQFSETRRKADLGVVMLGNSRLRHAVTFGLDPEKIVDLPDGRKMAALQFSYNAGRFDLYNEITWHILNAKPDIVIIQNSVISNAPLPGMPGLVKVSTIVLDYFRKLFARVDEYKEWRADRHMLLSRCDFKFDDYHMAQRRAFMEKDQHRLTPDNAGYKAAQDFIAQAHARGIKIVILDIPARTKLLSRFGMTRAFTDFHGLGYFPAPKQLLPRSYTDVLWAAYADPDEEAHYCDEVHLNAEGRKLFTNSLKHEIAREWLPREH
jgi:hypothetical protein